MDEVLTFKQMIVIDTGKMGLGWHYRRSYETVLVAHKGNSCKWYDQTDRIENIIRPGDYGIRKIKPSREQHPTEKSPNLAAHFIQLHTQSGEVVLDPFLGSGSTGVAAVNLGRKFIGIEIDSHWFKVARQKIEQAEWETRGAFFQSSCTRSERRKQRKGEDGFFSSRKDADQV